ncbi:glycosyltransferase family 4 protein [Candidatus Bipolaricaulota bacterium]
MPSASVTMFVMNNCDRDARVLKEARSLTEAGYAVRILAVLDSSTAKYEQRGGFTIERIAPDPVHHRVLRAARFLLRLPLQVARHVRKSIRLLRAGARRFAGRLVRSLGIRNAAPSPVRTDRWRTLWPFLLPFYGLRLLVRGVKHVIRWLAIVAYTCLRRLLLLFYRPLAYLDYYYRAYEMVRDQPSDVYHAHDLNTLPVAWWASRRMKGKLVYDSHEIYTEIQGLGKLERRYFKAIERALIKRADAVITIHDSAVDEFVARYGIPSPAIVRNCPRLRKIRDATTRLRDATGIDQKDILVLYQGGFSQYRGLPHLIEAMSHLRSDFKLVMMGWGKIEPQLREQAARKGMLNERVYFVPPVPQDELLEWTASADVGVIPYQAVSLNNYLCLPNKLFEYMAAGLPVAASAFPELSRVIEGHNMGVTFDPEDPTSIAEGIMRIAMDPDVHARMAGNARDASLVYNWENEEKSLLRVYGGLKL